MPLSLEDQQSIEFSFAKIKNSKTDEESVENIKRGIFVLNSLEIKLEKNVPLAKILFNGNGGASEGTQNREIDEEVLEVIKRDIFILSSLKFILEKSSNDYLKQTKPIYN